MLITHKKIFLLLSLFLLVSCTSKNDFKEVTPTPNLLGEDIEIIDDTNLKVQFLGYINDYQISLDHFEFHYQYIVDNIFDLGGDEVYLIWPNENQNITVDLIYYDEDFNEIYEPVTNFYYFDNEPFIIICNLSDLRPEVRININDNVSFPLQVSLESGTFEQLEFTQEIDYSYSYKDNEELIIIISDIVESTFDVIQSDYYSISMDEATEYLLMVAMYNNPSIVNSSYKIIDYVTYIFEIELLENWAIVLFDDYTGDLPFYVTDYIEVDYFSLERENDYQLLDVIYEYDTIMLLYEVINLDYGFSTSLVVYLVEDQISPINYRIMYIDKAVG